MLRDVDTPLGRATKRRYAAWVLYARAFVGNRATADDIVRQAVTKTYETEEDLTSPLEAHERVVAAIYGEARRLLLRRIAMAQEPTWPVGVFYLLADQRSATDPRRIVQVASKKLRQLSRTQRRSLQMLLVRRPPITLEDVARKRRVEMGVLTEEIEAGLDRMAQEYPPEPERLYYGGHASIDTLVSYVHGALTGEEAGAVFAHGVVCHECGERLSTLMIIRAGFALGVRPPLTPRGFPVMILVLTLAAGLVAGGMLGRALAPNPWAAHATEQTVPRWFHDFLYGHREAARGGDVELAAGLELLVRGEYQGAIERLSPLAETASSRREASAYLGIAQYLAGDLSGATLALLEAGTASRRAGRIADWYLVNALLARGDIDDARRRLDGLAMVGDWVGRRAAELLEALRQSEAQADEAVVA